MTFQTSEFRFQIEEPGAASRGFNLPAQSEIRLLDQSEICLLKSEIS